MTRRHPAGTAFAILAAFGIGAACAGHAPGNGKLITARPENDDPRLSAEKWPNGNFKMLGQTAVIYSHPVLHGRVISCFETGELETLGWVETTDHVYGRSLKAYPYWNAETEHHWIHPIKIADWFVFDPTGRLIRNESYAIDEDLVEASGQDAENLRHGPWRLYDWDHFTITANDYSRNILKTSRQEIWPSFAEIAGRWNIRFAEEKWGGIEIEISERGVITVTAPRDGAHKPGQKFYAYRDGDRILVPNFLFKCGLHEIRRAGDGIELFSYRIGELPPAEPVYRHVGNRIL